MRRVRQSDHCFASGAGAKWWKQPEHMMVVPSLEDVPAVPEIPASFIYRVGGRVLAGPDKRWVLECLAKANADRERYGVSRCRLCKRRTAAVACFMPFPGSDIALWVQQPEGKTRMLLYGLCRVCRRLPPDVRNARVEQSIREAHDKTKPVQ